MEESLDPNYFTYPILPYKLRRQMMRSRHSSVGRVSASSHTVRLLHDRSQSPYLSVQCLFTSMWMRTAQLPCWLPYGQWVSHQSLISENIHHMPPPSVSKATHCNFETQRRCHQKPKTGVSVASQKLKKTAIDTYAQPNK